MKVLKILGIVFGALLLLTGGALLAGSFAANKGNDAVQRSLQSSGFAGPVPGVITVVDGAEVTATFTDQQGQPQTGTGQAALSKPAKVGDTVSIYYSADDPTTIVATDVLGGSLSKVASGLRLGGIICLVVGAVLLLGGIVGLALGKKTPQAIAAGPGGPGNPAQPGYPAQPTAYPPQPPAYGQQPPPGYGQQPPYGQQQPPQQPYPPQPPRAYPPQPPQPGYPPPPPAPGYAQQPPATYNPLGPQQPPNGPPYPPTNPSAR